MVRGKKSGKKTGFTLIELLVVIAVIAILAAMLLPALARSKAQARSTVCKNHLHEMGIALRMYVDDCKAYPYYAVNPRTPYGVFPYSGSVNWFTILQPYYHLNWTNPVSHCPAYSGIITGTDISDFPQTFGSYSYNVLGVVGGSFAGLTSLGYLGGLGLGPGPNGLPRSENQVVVPSATFAFMDTMPTFPYSVELGKINAYQAGGLSYYWMGEGWSGLDMSGCVQAPLWLAWSNRLQTLPHGIVFNVVSGDGHVDGVRGTDLFNPTISARNWNFDHQPHPELWP